MGGMTEVRYEPHAEDGSWSVGWTPTRSSGDSGDPGGWNSLVENDFLFYKFWADVTLMVAGVDFSRTHLPVLDFALAWAAVPTILKRQDRIDVHMSVEALTYTAVREGPQVVISSNAHGGRAVITFAEVEDLVIQMVEGAFAMLYRHHPELRRNPYLVDLTKRLAQSLCITVAV